MQIFHSLPPKTVFIGLVTIFQFFDYILNLITTPNSTTAVEYFRIAITSSFDGFLHTNNNLSIQPNRTTIRCTKRNEYSNCYQATILEHGITFKLVRLVRFELTLKRV
jgi:hypothetical protein